MDTAPWPGEQADEIRKWAQEVGMPEVNEVLDTLASIMGNAPLVEHYASIWSPTTMERLTSAQDDFAMKVSNVNDVWTGSAADEFKAWATKFNTSLNDLKGVLDRMRDTLFECSSIITDVYRLAIELIAGVASQLIKLTTGIAGSIPDFLDIFNVIGQILGWFIEQAGRLISEGLDKMARFRRTMSALEGKVAALNDLVPMGRVVAETGGWQVRPTS